MSTTYFKLPIQTTSIPFAYEYFGVALLLVTSLLRPYHKIGGLELVYLLYLNPTECWFFMSFFDVLSTYLFAWLYFMVTLSPVFLYTSSL